MKLILVAGASGQLSQALMSRLDYFNSLDHFIVQRGRPHLDFTKPDTIEQNVMEAKPALVVNAAGWTSVDDAETHPDEAKQLNETAPGILAAVCATSGIPLIHLSSDYVFDGALGSQYAEQDPAKPINIYGATKLAGEKAVLKESGPAIILRTSWLYSPYGNNFLMTMLKHMTGMRFDEKKRLEVVNDQRGRPTNAVDLANAIALIANHLDKGWKDQYGGIFHVTGSGEATWHEFATSIFEMAATHQWKTPEVAAVTTEQRGAKAQRPKDSRLNCSKINQVFGIKLPRWQHSLKQLINEIQTKGRMPGRTQPGIVNQQDVLVTKSFLPV